MRRTRAFIELCKVVSSSNISRAALTALSEAFSGVARAMVVEFVLAAGLALRQAGELFGFAEKYFDLESQVVVVGDLRGLLLQVGRGQQDVPLAAGVQQQYHAQPAAEVLRV